MTTPARGTRPDDVRSGPKPMTPERWRAIDAVLQASLACAPAQRAKFVADACGSDVAMRHEVESLLAAHEQAGDFLEQPALPESGVLVPAPAAGARLAVAVEGRYEVERELGRGGMATVHQARDLRHGRRVAIKVLRDELSAALGAERFLKEIEVTASLQHPHILPLFDSGSVGGLLYYVMPLVEGETLRERLSRDGQLPVDEAVRLAGEIADALEHAHRRGVVHRDVKPENVLLQGERGSTHALVADFGIALAIEQAGGERLTRTGLTLGTPQYMAPEQARGEKGVDARADVYALGAVLYEMLAGEPPFAAPTAQQVVARVMHDAPPSLTARGHRVPPHLDAAVRRALAKRPDDRFPSAATFAAALAAPPVAAPLPFEHDDRVVRPRTLMLATAAKLVVAALLVGVGGGWWLASARSTAGAPATQTAQPPQGTQGAQAVNDIVTSNVAWGEGNLGLALVDRAGQPQGAITSNRPWTPRFSPDGRKVVYGAFGEGRGSSDLFVADLEARTARRLTDDDGDANDAQWSPDGRAIAYSRSASGGKDAMVYWLDGGKSKPIAARAGNQFPSDWLRDGSAVLVTDDASERGDRDVLVQPTNGREAWPLAATAANESAARLSPDGRWVAYTSDEGGRSAVYVQRYPTAGRRVKVSNDDGRDPVWKGDGSELYYWQGDQLVAARVEKAGPGGPLVVAERTTLFRARYHAAVNANYDVSPDGQRFVVVVER
jgi:eukaryotic-like serine/threonine-protein kinase